MSRVPVPRMHVLEQTKDMETACPICLEGYGPERPRCAPADGSFPTQCRHGFCEPCGFELVRRNPREWRCPTCRSNISEWLAHEFCWTPENGISLEDIASYVDRTARLLEASGDQPELLRLADRILQELSPPHLRAAR